MTEQIKMETFLRIEPSINSGKHPFKRYFQNTKAFNPSEFSNVTTGNSLSGIGGIGGHQFFASLPRIKKKRPGDKIQPTPEDPQGL